MRLRYASPGMQYSLEWWGIKRVPANDSIPRSDGMADMRRIGPAPISIIMLTTPLSRASIGHISVKNGPREPTRNWDGVAVPPQGRPASRSRDYSVSSMLLTVDKDRGLRWSHHRALRFTLCHGARVSRQRCFQRYSRYTSAVVVHIRNGHS